MMRTSTFEQTFGLKSEVLLTEQTITHGREAVTIFDLICCQHLSCTFVDTHISPVNSISSSGLPLLIVVLSKTNRRSTSIDIDDVRIAEEIKIRHNTRTNERTDEKQKIE